MAHYFNLADSRSFNGLEKLNVSWNSTTWSGMHSLRPADQMWPGQAFNLARKAPCAYFVYLGWFFFDKTTLWLCLKILPPTGKNRCITKNCADSYSNPGNGMYQLAFLGNIDIYAVKNRLIRYLWMLKIHILSIMPFPRFD